MRTLTIDNFKGSMTYFADGDINSGLVYAQNSAGWNPFLLPGNLTWNNAPVQIDSGASVITDLILAGKERVESGILYVYAIGHTGRVYKIQVNDPTTYNANYDNPVLLTTLTSGSPTFTRGAFIDFYGATEKIYIGHDKGVTSIEFTGASETAVGLLASWTQNVPRPIKQFLGKMYVGNGSNVAEIDTTLTVTDYTKLDPGFPDNTQVRDMDLTPDGNYMQIVVSRLALPDQTLTTQGVSGVANGESYIFSWNGTDTGYTSFHTFPNFSLTANTLFQNYQYTFGYDQFGLALFAPTEKVLWVTEGVSPPPNAIMSIGNMVLFPVPLSYGGVMEMDLIAWGSVDFEIGQNPLGYYDLMFLNATEPETDILRAPFLMPISNAGIGSSFNGYADNLFGSSKIYFSTLEGSSTTTAYRLYKWSLNTVQLIPSGDIIVDAVYQTQSQMFSKKQKIKEVRIYGQPWVAGNEFQIDLIGSAGTAIAGSTKVFTAGTNLTVGDDYAWYTPDCAPTYMVGLSITNLGLVNHVINKVEIDVTDGGK